VRLITLFLSHSGTTVISLTRAKSGRSSFVDSVLLKALAVRIVVLARLPHVQTVMRVHTHWKNWQGNCFSGYRRRAESNVPDKAWEHILAYIKNSFALNVLEGLAHSSLFLAMSAS